MAYESRAYDNEHGDPVVVLVTTGTHDVSRLVQMLNRGNSEQCSLAETVTRQVKRHNGGRAALELLKAHGGPDFTADGTVWSGYDDDERGFPNFTTLEAAQQYAEHQLRTALHESYPGGEADDTVLGWAERKAYTDAHEGRAGMFDLAYETAGISGYVVYERPIHRTAAEAIRADRKRDAS